MEKMPEDTKSIAKKIIEDASTELKFENHAVLKILTQYLDDGTLTGLKGGRVKKISDSILIRLRKEGDEVEV
jgi:hypothetical protein